MKKVLFPILALILALGLALPMAAGASPGPGIVGLWHLDDNALDSSGNANDGTVYGAAYVAGMFDKALSFDGFNDYVDCGAGIAITTAITVEAWIKPSAFTNYDAIVANFVWPTNPEGFSFRVMANGKLVWRAVLSVNNAYSITSNAALETGNWYHVAVTHDSSYTRLYINGTLDKEEISGGTIINLGKALKIGWDNYAADRVFNGLIDEVRIWDVALTAEEVFQSYIAPVVTTEITSGKSTISVGAEESWNITINICGGPEGVDDVVVQGGIGADLVVTHIDGTPVAYLMVKKTTQTVGDVTLSKKGGKMGATIVTWDVGDLTGGDPCQSIVITVQTGYNPKDKHEFTSVEDDHELDGGFSATFMYNAMEYETPETAPQTVDVVEAS